MDYAKKKQSMDSGADLVNNKDRDVGHGNL